MARIKGVDLPNEKSIWIALTSIYGIGRQLSRDICDNAKVDYKKKAKDVNDEEIAALRAEIDKHLVEGDLRREVAMNIKNKMEIGSYEGGRHKKGLPVRGQRTRTNARTRKGKPITIANKKK